MIREKEFNGSPGLGMLLVFLVLFFLSCYWLIAAARAGLGIGILGSILLLFASIIGLAGLYVVNPNQSKVLQLFGVTRLMLRSV